jgi:hypothetical protein
MKIENKKVKQNDLINQKYFLNFCFINAIKQYFKLLHKYMFYIPFCRKFHAEFKYDISFSYWTLLDPIPDFTAEYVEMFN